MRLQFALVQYSLRSSRAAGFLPMMPPVLVREQAIVGTGFFPADREQVYSLEPDPLFLVGTSEVSLAALMGEILDEDELPLRYVGFSSCFRREAGAAGKDTRGIFRTHQFDKVEMFSFCQPETSWEEHEMIARARAGDRRGARPALPRRQHRGRRSRRLGGEEVRHRGVAARPGPLPRADLVLEHHRLPGAPARQPLPRRAREDPVLHTLNGTAVTSSRTLIAMLEYGQQADGSIRARRAARVRRPGRDRARRYAVRPR